MKKLLVFAGCFTGLTMLTGFYLMKKIPSVAAFSDTLTATVNVSCALTADVTTPHTAAVKPGTYTTNVGTTDLEVICDGAGTWQITAIGYGNNTEGDTDLTHSTVGTLKIPTGAVSSGNTSGWAMKIGVGSTEAGTPSVKSAFQDFAAVPSEWTEVASMTTPTAKNKAASVTSTYSIYTIATQQAGEYHGKVKYALVYPLPPICGSTPTMQDFDKSSISSMTIGVPISLCDSRDGTIYKVAKLEDGNVWMQENLALEGGTTITSADSNIAADSYTLPTSTSESTSPAWVNSYDVAYLNSDYKNTKRAAKGSSPAGKIGVYYNYCAATAGTYCYAEGSGTGNAEYDICPKGWRMPTGGSSGKYQALYTKYSSNVANYQSALSTPLSGYFNAGWALSRGSGGYFWSSTRTNGRNMYYLGVDSSSVGPANSSARDNGFSMRCVVSSEQ